MRFGDGGDDEHEDEVGVNGYEDFDGFFIEFKLVSINEGLTNGSEVDDGDAIGI